MVGAPGVAADLSHIDTPADVSGHGMTLKQFTGPDALPEADKAAFQAKAFDDALKGCDIVVRAVLYASSVLTSPDWFRVSCDTVTRVGLILVREMQN